MIRTVEAMAVTVDGEQRLPAIAASTRAGVRDVLGWCRDRGHVDTNAADGIRSLPATKATKHHAEQAVPAEKLAGVLRMVDAGSANPSIKAAIRWAALTGCRSQEARSAKFSDVRETDHGPVWTISAAATKQGRQHDVPLSSGAVEVLERQRQATGGEGLIFPSGRGGGELQSSSLVRVFRAASGSSAALHSLRGSLRGWAEDQGYRPDVAEATLGHAVGGMTERSYSLSDRIKARRELLEAYGRVICGEAA